MLVVPVILLAAAAVAGMRPAPARASCAAVVAWHDAAYFGYAASGARPRPLPGRRVGGVVAPGCNDTGGGPVGPTPVAARGIAGVPAQVALLSSGEICIPAGEYPQTPPFPVRLAHVDDATRACRVTSHTSLSGLAEPSAWGILLEHGKPVFVDVHTRFTGLIRDGVPFVGWHQAVRIEAVRCGRETVARRVLAAGTIVAAPTAEDVLGANWRGGPNFFTDPSTWAAAAIVAVGAMIVLGLRAGRRRPPGVRG